MLNTSPDASLTESSQDRFIVIEGIDGTGKTTLAALLADALRAQGRQVVLSFEPTRGPYGMRIRELAAKGREGVTPQEEADLFMADRREHVEQVIRPALESGATVILDRYFYSTMAYQGARGMDPEAIHKAHQCFAPEPDILIILELPIEEALVRITEKRGSTPDAFEGADYLMAVQALFQSFRHPRLMRLDARVVPEALAQAILREIARI